MFIVTKLQPEIDTNFPLVVKSVFVQTLFFDISFRCLYYCMVFILQPEIDINFPLEVKSVFV